MEKSNNLQKINGENFILTHQFNIFYYDYH